MMASSRSRSASFRVNRRQRRKKAGGRFALPVAGHDDEGETHAPDLASDDRHAVLIPRPVEGHHVDLRQCIGDPHQFGYLEAALLEDVQQVIGQVDVALVDLVDEQDAGPLGGKQRRAERAEADEAADALIRTRAAGRRPGGGAPALAVLRPGDGPRSRSRFASRSRAIASYW